MNKDIAQQFADELRPLLNKAKSPKVCLFASMALRRIQRGAYDSVDEFAADARAHLARDVDPDTLTDFLALIGPIIAELLANKAT